MATLCKLKKKIRRQHLQQPDLEAQASHQCKKCKRLACSKKLLCKPEKR